MEFCQLLIMDVQSSSSGGRYYGHKLTVIFPGIFRVLFFSIYLRKNSAEYSAMQCFTIIAKI